MILLALRGTTVLAARSMLNNFLVHKEHTTIYLGYQISVCVHPVLLDLIVTDQL